VTVSIELRLFDVPGRCEVSQVGKRYSGAKAALPRMAHKAADGILEFLTGERGPFDSMIALVSTGGSRLKDVYRFTFDMDAPARVTDERSIVVTPRWFFSAVTAMGMDWLPGPKIDPVTTAPALPAPSTSATSVATRITLFIPLPFPRSLRNEIR
jgi:hypothetical protein